MSEVLKKGRMTKKGHKIHNWKDRWFILTPTTLAYYESEENPVLKVNITSHSYSYVWSLIQGVKEREIVAWTPETRGPVTPT